MINDRFDELCDEYNSRLSNSGRFLKRLNNEFLEITSNELSLQVFLTMDEKLWALKNRKRTRPQCYCGTNTNFHTSSLKYHVYCSARCSRSDPDTSSNRTKARLAKNPAKKAQETIEKRYGKDGIKQARQEGVYKKFGVLSYFSTPEFKKKREQVCVDKYGTANYVQTEEYLVKSKNTSLLKYGVDHPAQQHMMGVLNFLNDREWLYDQYYNKYNSIEYISSILGIDQSTLVSYMNKNSIPIEQRSGFSRRCVDWLNSIEKTEGVHIQHAKNMGEYRIPGTRYKADGYCKDTNTIYEFYGDAYHGNPETYAETDTPHPFSDKTAKELYEYTIMREDKIKSLGYNVVTIWENEWVKNGKN